MVDRIAARLHLRQCDRASRREPFAVQLRQPAAARVPGVEITQLDSQHRRLHGIETRVVADLGVYVFRGLTVVTQAAQARGELRVVGSQGAAVAERAEILGRIKAEAADRANTAGSL